MSNKINCRELKEKIDDLNSQKNKDQSKIDELNNLKAKYDEVSKNYDPDTAEDFVDLDAASNQMSKTIINDYKTDLKGLDPDDVEIGGHDDMIDPRASKDVQTDSSDFSSKPTSVNDVSALKGIIGSRTSGENLSQRFQAVNEWVINNELESVRKLGAVVQSIYRTVDGKDIENIIGSSTVQEQAIWKINAQMGEIDAKAIKNYRKRGGNLKIGKNHITGEKDWNNVYKDATRMGRGNTDLSVYSYQDENYLALVKEISQGYDELYKSMDTRLKNSGHEYAEELKEVNDYRNRVFDSDAIGQLNITATRKSIEDSIEQLILQKQPSLKGQMVGTEEYSSIIARGYWAVLNSSAHGLDEISHLVSPNDMTEKALDAIEEQLRIVAPDSPLASEFREVKDNIKSQLTKKSDPKTRLHLEENGTLNLINRETGEAFTMRFDDILENNARLLMNSYNNKVTSFTALGETAKRYNIPEMARMDFFQKIKDDAVKEMQSSSGKDRAFVEDYIDFLEETAFHRPHRAYNEDMTKLLQGLNNFVFATQLTKLPLTMIIEEGKLQAMIGFKTWLKTFRGSLMDANKALEFGDDYMDMDASLKFLLGDQDIYLQNMNPLIDDLGHKMNQGSKIVNKTVNGLDKTAKVASNVTGIRAYDRNIRSRAGKGILFNFGTLAKRGKLVTELTSDKRALANFLTPEKLKTLEKRFNTYGKFDGDHMIGIDLKRWNLEDPESLDNFMFSLKKMSNHVVQTPNFNTVPKWMQTPEMKIAFMLRSFGLHEVQITGKYNLHMRDKESVSTLMYITMMASLSTYLHIKANAISKPDPEAYEAKMLDPKRFIANTVNRIPGSVIFAPLADMAYGAATGGDQLFTLGAKGGVGVGNIPVVGIADKLVNIASGQGSLDDVSRLIPIVGTHPLTRAGYAAIADNIE